MLQSYIINNFRHRQRKCLLSHQPNHNQVSYPGMYVRYVDAIFLKMFKGVVSFV